jgi:hypothetical protein
MWIGMIFVCAASIPTELCGMDNSYEILRIDRAFQTRQECIEASTHHFEATEVSGARNARVECEPKK